MDDMDQLESSPELTTTGLLGLRNLHFQETFQEIVMQIKFESYYFYLDYIYCFRKTYNRDPVSTL